MHDHTANATGTTNRIPLPFEGGSTLFWKLQAEAFLLSAGLGTTVVIKPCGLADGSRGTDTLVTGHNDKIAGIKPIARADVAAVAVQAVLGSNTSQTLRFDLCSMAGPPTSPDEVLMSARFPWQ